jgi:hypothetical protein
MAALWSAAGAPGVPGLVALRATRRSLCRLSVRVGPCPTSSRGPPVPFAPDVLGTRAVASERASRRTATARAHRSVVRPRDRRACQGSVHTPRQPAHPPAPAKLALKGRAPTTADAEARRRPPQLLRAHGCFSPVSSALTLPPYSTEAAPCRPPCCPGRELAGGALQADAARWCRGAPTPAAPILQLSPKPDP